MNIVFRQVTFSSVGILFHSQRCEEKSHLPCTVLQLNFLEICLLEMSKQVLELANERSDSELTLHTFSILRLSKNKTCYLSYQVEDQRTYCELSRLKLLKTLRTKKIIGADDKYE